MSLRLRPAIRALLVDPAERILMVRFEFPRGTVWSLPGGGIEPGEQPLDALRRELAEEVGLLDPEIGPCLWDRTHVIPMGPWDGQRDRTYLVPVAAHEPRPQLSWAQLHAERVFELRWWTVPELLAAETGPPPAFRFAPFELPELVASVLRDGPPAEPHVIHNQLPPEER